MHLKSVMNREYSIQLVYQLSILIHNYLNFPIIELVYGDQRPNIPTIQWSSKLTLQCISALLSAYSTLSLPILVEDMRAIKEFGIYCSFSKNCSLLFKRMFNLVCHLCTTYLTIFMVMESDRFQYLRRYISGGIADENSKNYNFVIYGCIIFFIFPFLLILANVLAVTNLLVGKTRKVIRKIVSRFGKKVRIRF